MFSLNHGENFEARAICCHGDKPMFDREIQGVPNCLDPGPKYP